MNHVRSRLHCSRTRPALLAVGLLLPSLGAGCSAPGKAGRPWTIQCLELAGPDSATRIEQTAETLRRTPGIRSDDVYVRHDTDAARIYYGAYYGKTDSKTRKWTLPKQIHEDITLLRELVDPTGRRYFFQALPVPLPLADAGDPAWSLGRATGQYSLQIAVFEPTDEFFEYKRAAAEFCEHLRDKGHEAYYHHGPASSVVTVGAFGDDAVRRGPDGHTYYSEQVQALQRNELFRHNLVNGAIYKVKDPEGRAVPVPSRLILIPRDDPPG